MSFDTNRGDDGFAQSKPVGIFDSHHLADDFPNAPAILGYPSTGLSHIYIIDSVVETRNALHSLMCSRPNSVVRAYDMPGIFLRERAELDAGCILVRDEGVPGRTASLVAALKPGGRFHSVVLTSKASAEIAVEVMKAGAADYLDPAADPARLMIAVDETLNTVRQDLAVTAAIDRACARVARLSGREREVLAGLVEGKSNKMIAIALNISPRTIEIYRAHLMEKLGTHSLSETLRIAFMAGIG